MGRIGAGVAGPEPFISKNDILLSPSAARGSKHPVKTFSPSVCFHNAFSPPKPPLNTADPSEPPGPPQTTWGSRRFGSEPTAHTTCCVQKQQRFIFSRVCKINKYIHIFFKKKHLHIKLVPGLRARAAPARGWSETHLRQVSRYSSDYEITGGRSTSGHCAPVRPAPASRSGPRSIKHHEPKPREGHFRLPVALLFPQSSQSSTPYPTSSNPGTGGGFSFVDYSALQHPRVSGPSVRLSLTQRRNQSLLGGKEGGQSSSPSVRSVHILVYA